MQCRWRAARTWRAWAPPTIRTWSSISRRMPPTLRPQWAFIRGAGGALKITRSPSATRTAANAALHVPSRSRARNRRDSMRLPGPAVRCHARCPAPPPGPGGQGLAPGRTGATRRRAGARGVEDLPNRRGGDPIPEPGQLPLGSVGAPPRTLPGRPQNERPDRRWGRWTSGALPPPDGGEPAMPGEQGDGATGKTPVGVAGASARTGRRTRTGGRTRSGPDSPTADAEPRSRTSTRTVPRPRRFRRAATPTRRTTTPGPCCPVRTPSHGHVPAVEPHPSHLRQRPSERHTSGGPCAGCCAPARSGVGTRLRPEENLLRRPLGRVSASFPRWSGETRRGRLPPNAGPPR